MSSGWRPVLALLALCAEAALLAHVAGLGGAAAAAFGFATCGLALSARAWPATFEAFALGGLGMTVGWWADLGFVSLAPSALPPALPAEAWCGSAGALAGVQLVSWMNGGMLLGTAAAALASRCPPERYALECVGMLLAMHLAARAALPLALGSSLGVLAPHAAMSAGMLAGMQLARAEDLRVRVGRALFSRVRVARLPAG
jgi:hypothetical protein